ncbi:DNA cytosine methyltransferase [Klebsiella pneumoniae]|uniref:DNA cytosine methyltransferase n=1 Tax=Klebsiella pneumoniae TaxID=573 RepID=UPI000808CC33|nr:DNA cytosine methyltransferase [Klebsiella pneumoniae]VVJ29429.1 Modification methylase HaeIII [Klebsiella quasipneumoniae]HDS4970415.1 DNA cytosine methyltransferase [Klebsiella pneumoniae subsp. pneumoniae]SBX79578.1 DNA-cytosine methyltransferase [Klebsiella pneumoniae]SSG75421.1 DNA-cytosine methyltransferase [Klebsiella pneumoniae]HEE0702356.1 DNA cytosine methyltransferase [Klebsiella pneumoniae]
MYKIYAIDLFCGAGGLTHGLIQAGINVIAGIDLDPDCQWAYEHNNKTKYINSDISDVTGQDLMRLWPSDGLRLLAGCAPCQPFSSYRKGKIESEDGKWKLLGEFGRLVKECDPDLITMENVPRLQKHKIFTEFVKDLKTSGYKVWHGIVDCQQYGVPQKRQRLVLLASKINDVALIPPTHSEDNYVTVKDVISHLPEIKPGQSDDKDPLHVAQGMSPLNLERIRQSKPGGTWKDWDPELVAACHKKSSGKTYTSVYGRMKWDEPAPTMTTLCFGFGNGRFGHPQQDRAISLREAAILQSFPGNYVFSEPGEKITFATVGRLIGNAVPVKLGEVVGKSLINSL